MEENKIKAFVGLNVFFIENKFCNFSSKFINVIPLGFSRMSSIIS